MLPSLRCLLTKLAWLFSAERRAESSTKDWRATFPFALLPVLPHAVHSQCSSVAADHSAVQPSAVQCSAVQRS